MGLSSCAWRRWGGERTWLYRCYWWVYWVSLQWRRLPPMWLTIIELSSLMANVEFSSRALFITLAARLRSNLFFFSSIYFSPWILLAFCSISSPVFGGLNLILFTLWWLLLRQMWPDLIQKSKDGGLDIIETYVFWNLHEPTEGQVPFLFLFFNAADLLIICFYFLFISICSSSCGYFMEMHMGCCPFYHFK